MDKRAIASDLFRDESETDRLKKINEKLQEELQKLRHKEDKILANLSLLNEELSCLRTEAVEVTVGLSKLTSELDLSKSLYKEKKEMSETLRLSLFGKGEEVEDKRFRVRELERVLVNREAIIAQLGGNLTVTKQKDIPYMFGYRAIMGDQVDEMLARYINKTGIQLPITRLGGGFYMFGTKKIYAKIMNAKLVVRVGGGFSGIDEFIKTHGESELVKLKRYSA